MKIRQHIRKIAIASAFAAGVQVAFAAFSFTGITDETTKNSKYSLKNISSLAHNSLSYSSLKNTLQFKGSYTLQPKEVNGGMEVNSMLRYNTGNTTYIYPYKFKIKVPKFKTPSPDQH